MQFCRVIAKLVSVVLLCSVTADAQTVQEAKPTRIDMRFLDEDPAVQKTSRDEGVLPEPAEDADNKAEPAPSDDANDSELQFDNGASLSLADVVASVYSWYPEIAQARQLAALAGGQSVEAFGAYDTKLQAFSLSEPTGFYENYRQGIGAARQTWWGGYLSAGYRIGRGNFAPWYLERETNKGGEFKVAAAQPLLRGRAIDPERVAVFKASLAQQAAQPTVQQSILDASRDASELYWKWVAAGAIFQAQRELLELAVTRGEQFDVGFKAGKFPEIDVILNRQLIAERRAKTIESEQKFQAAGFKLSLYLRDGQANPLVPNKDWLPEYFPIIEPMSTSSIEEDIAVALTSRPETRLLGFELRKLSLDQRLAYNQMMPNLDLIAEASQDVGEPTSKKRDKSEFELLVGFQAELPLQRRKARGKLQSTNAKIAQVNLKLGLQRDKIAMEVRTYRNAVELSSQVVEQAELSLRAAFETLDRYRFAFEKDKVDLIYLNLIETKANETEIKLVEAQMNWFLALAELSRALGLDPLEASMRIAALPLSRRPGPGHLPESKPIKNDGEVPEKK